MAWIYFQVGGGLVKPSRNGSDPSFTVKTTDTLKGCYCPEWQEANYSPALSGMTCERCGALCCLRSISSSPVSPARISLMQELKLAWTASEADYFSRSSDWFASFDHNSYSWKMCQASFPFLGESQEQWPRYGMIVDGVCYPLPTWGRRTFENAGSVWPTPLATNGTKDTANSTNYGTPKLPMVAAALARPTPTARDWKGQDTPSTHGNHSPSLDLKVSSAGHTGYLNPRFVEVMMGWIIGATRLECWATEWFRPKRAKRSSASQESEANP